jgi:hypothetical protein
MRKIMKNMGWQIGQSIENNGRKMLSMAIEGD